MFFKYTKYSEQIQIQIMKSDKIQMKIHHICICKYNTDLIPALNSGVSYSIFFQQRHPTLQIFIIGVLGHIWYYINKYIISKRYLYVEWTFLSIWTHFVSGFSC